MDCPLRNFRGVQKNENKIIQHHPEFKLLARELRKTARYRKSYYCKISNNVGMVFNSKGKCPR